MTNQCQEKDQNKLKDGCLWFCESAGINDMKYAFVSCCKFYVTVEQWHRTLRVNSHKQQTKLPLKTYLGCRYVMINMFDNSNHA